MEAVLALHADDTHVYPGARLTSHEAPVLPDEPAEAVLLFRDDSRAEAVLTPSDDAFILHVEAYTTAAGTAIGAKSWHLRVADDGTLTVRSAADPGPPSDPVGRA